LSPPARQVGLAAVLDLVANGWGIVIGVVVAELQRPYLSCVHSCAVGKQRGAKATSVSCDRKGVMARLRRRFQNSGFSTLRPNSRL